MLEFTHGDILSADAEALVNTVNCVGIMGRGVALQFRKAYPVNYAQYKAVCDRQELEPGKVFTYTQESLTNPHYIINFPTKVHWKGKSRLDYIEKGLEALIAEVKRLDIRSIALPPLGCGLGGLNWADVRPRIEAAFAALPGVHVLLYEPGGAPAPAVMVKDTQSPRMTLSRAVLIELAQEYLSGLMDVSISLLEIHKLMYFMQEGGEPLKLRYAKAPYGPYAENLRHALSAMEGHFITGYGDGQDDPRRQIEIVPSAEKEARELLAMEDGSKECLARVASLIRGFETPFGMELLATVHWVVTREGATTDDEMIARVYAWGGRKRMFQEGQIRLAFRVLKERGWLEATSP